MVVCSQAGDGHPSGRGAWVQVPDDVAADGGRAARICLEGERWDTDGPTLGEILEVVYETWRRLREGPLTEAC